MLYPSLHLHFIELPNESASDLYIQPDAIERYTPLDEGGSRVYPKSTPLDGFIVNESPDMIAKAINQAIRQAASLAVFGQFEAEQAVNNAMQQGANGVAVVQKPGLVVPH